MPGFESRVMVGRGPDGMPQVMEVDDDGQFVGISEIDTSIGEIDTKVDTIIVGIGTISTHVPQFGGAIWYVSAGASAGGDGTTPDTPFATITEALAAAAAGDAITVKAGTYAENVDWNLVGLELWGEVGATLAGTLTVSANSCRVRGMVISPTAAVGVALTGSSCRVENTHIIGTATIGFDIDGSMNMLVHCMTSGYTVTAFDVAGPSTHLYRCTAQGANTATRGFYLSSATADNGYVENCMSVGNTTTGYEVVSGATSIAFYHCLSGNGDGRWVDADSASVWSNFTFDDRVYHVTTFNNTGPSSDNLFRVYGSVIITEFSGEVATVLAADIGNGYIELDDGTNTIDVTDSPGPAFNSLPVLSFLHKIDDATVQIAIENSSQVRLYEDATKFGEDPNFQVTAKAATATYIRLTYSGAGASGAIHWHCQWCPLSEDGFVEAA